MNSFFKAFVLSLLFFVPTNSVFADTTSFLLPVADGIDDTVRFFNTGVATCDTVDCYLEVDELSGSECGGDSDGDTSYVYSSQDASQTFDLDESSVPDGSTITQIDVVVCAKNNVTSPPNTTYQTRYCLDSSCSNSGTNITASNSYVSTTQSFSGLSYLKDSSSDIEVGVLDTSNKNIRVSKIKALITYNPPVGDTEAPATVTDLLAFNPTTTSIDLSWTAPGDDGSTGTATSYDVRYSTGTINDGNWDLATQTTGEPTPSIAGTNETLTVSGLNPGVKYYFAIKTSDEIPNISALSNIVNQTTILSSDTTAPSAVSDLSTSGETITTIDLSWTAPGDDGSTGTATSYDVRYALSAINNDVEFDSATQVAGEPTPSVAGSSESMTVTGLSQGTTYYFAVKTSDEVFNISTLSNSPSGTTIASDDTTAPSPVSDLSTSNPTTSSVDLSWTAPGDDGSTGTATSYDVRYSTSNITSDTDFNNATQVSDEPSPSVAGSSESMTVTGLSQGATYYFAVKTSDEVPNTSTLSNIVNATTQENTISIPSGSGGGNVSPTRVSFSGWAFPGSQVKVLIKSNLSPDYKNVPISTYNMSKNGFFSLDYLAFLTGKYFIGLKAVDRTGHETGILSFGVDFVTQPSLIVEDIVIPPTVIFDKDVLSPDDGFKIYGYSSPGSKIELKIDDIIKPKITSDDNGYYSFSFSSSDFDKGSHYVRVKQETEGLTSGYSFPKTFKVSELIFPGADFNNDNKVDITDWSVFLFRWGSDDSSIRSKIDIDNNGIIDITDFSIFLKAISL